MVCPQCRAENPADNAYCGGCGRALTEEATPIPRYPDRAALLRREIVIVALGIVLLLGAAFGVWYALFYRRSPEMAVRRFIEADRAGQFDLAQQYVSTRWDSQVIFSALRTIRQQTGGSPFQNYRIAGSRTSGQMAEVYVEITWTPPASLGVNVTPPPGAPAPAAQSRTDTLTFFLVREENEWRIDAPQTLAGVLGLLLALGYQQISPNSPNLVPPGGLPGLSGPPITTWPPATSNPPAAPSTPNASGSI